MLAATALMFALAATGLAQTVPAGYRTVYLTSLVNTKFAIEPKTATNGSAIVVFVSQHPTAVKETRSNIFTFPGILSITSQINSGISKTATLPFSSQVLHSA
jgi:hypothetical protein